MRFLLSFLLTTLSAMMCHAQLLQELSIGDSLVDAKQKVPSLTLQSQSNQELELYQSTAIQDQIFRVLIDKTAQKIVLLSIEQNTPNPQPIFSHFRFGITTSSVVWSFNPNKTDIFMDNGRYRPSDENIPNYLKGRSTYHLKTGPLLIFGFSVYQKRANAHLEQLDQQNRYKGSYIVGLNSDTYNKLDGLYGLAALSKVTLIDYNFAQKLLRENKLIYKTSEPIDWQPPKILDNQYSPNQLSASHCTVKGIYKTDNKAVNFSGANRKYFKYRSYFSSEVKEQPINFAGENFIFTFSMENNFMMYNARTGIFSSTPIDTLYKNTKLSVRPDSCLVLARWRKNGFCYRQYYSYQNSKWKTITKPEIEGSADACLWHEIAL